MPEFFVPSCSSEREAKDWWQRARREAEDQGHTCGLRRVFRLRYEHDGNELVAGVGELAEFAEGRRVVGAIFDALDSSCVIWGPTIGGPARIVPGVDVREVCDFGP